jgi:type II secretory pathway pseudopilin PulG
MSVLAIIIVVFAVVVAVLAFLGYRVMRKRQAEQAGTFDQRLVAANEALADARAEDRGWDLPALEEAARSVVAQKHPNVNVRRLHLVQVIDKPGTEDDQARFHVDVAMGRDFEVLLGRRGGQWTELEAG